MKVNANLKWHMPIKGEICHSIKSKRSGNKIQNKLIIWYPKMSEIWIVFPGSIKKAEITFE